MGGGHAGLSHEPRSLSDGQWQVAELVRELVRIDFTEPADPRLQDRHRFRPGQHVDLDRDGDFVPVPFTGSDQHMPAGARQPGHDVLGAARHRRRPAATLPAPAVQPEPPTRCLGVRTGRDTTQRKPQSGGLVPDQLGLLGADPPDQVVVRERTGAHTPPPAGSCPPRPSRAVPAPLLLSPASSRSRSSASSWSRPVNPGLRAGHIPHPRRIARKPRPRSPQPPSGPHSRPAPPDQ